MRTFFVKAVCVLFALIVSVSVALGQYEQGEGGMDLYTYCQRSNQDLVLVRYSADGWRCWDREADTYHEIDLIVVCFLQYGEDRPHPMMGNQRNPYSLYCTGLGGGLDLEPYCQYSPLALGSRYVVEEPSEPGGAFCEDADGDLHEIDMQLACNWMYPFEQTQAVSGGNAASWTCEPIAAVQ